MRIAAERHLLQMLVGLAGLVPVTAGLLGAISGGAFFELLGSTTAQSHGTYLSGLLLGIGLAFWSCIPVIERKEARFFVLTGIVVMGGVARAVAALTWGAASPIIWLALAMELAVTPGLYLWVSRIAALLVP